MRRTAGQTAEFGVVGPIHWARCPWRPSIVPIIVKPFVVGLGIGPAAACIANSWPGEGTIDRASYYLNWTL